MIALKAKPCLHCELRPQASKYRLCRRCSRVDGLKNVYKLRPEWNETWDMHLQTLVNRAQRGEPLFVHQEIDVVWRPRSWGEIKATRLENGERIREERRASLRVEFVLKQVRKAAKKR